MTIKKFGASWCGPCKTMDPIFNEMRVDFPEVTFVNIDVDTNSMETVKYAVTSVPTFIFEDGNRTVTYKGIIPKTVFANHIRNFQSGQ